MALRRLVTFVLLLGLLLATRTLLASDRRQQACEHGQRQTAAASALFGAVSREPVLESCEGAG